MTMAWSSCRSTGGGHLESRQMTRRRPLRLLFRRTCARLMNGEDQCKKTEAAVTHSIV